MTTYFISPDTAFDIGLTDHIFANNASTWQYDRGDNCDHVVILPINESQLFCPVCTHGLDDQPRQYSMLKKRFFAPPFKMPMPDHYNVALGEYVPNKVKLEDRWKQKSEERTERLNLDTNFELRDVREYAEEAGVTDDGLEATYRRTHDEGDPAGARRGEREATRWL
jgi:hypothetical protein